MIDISQSPEEVVSYLKSLKKWANCAQFPILGKISAIVSVALQSWSCQVFLRFVGVSNALGLRTPPQPPLVHFTQYLL